MPLFISGIVALKRVDKDTSKRNLFKTVAFMATTSGEFIEVAVNVWVDYDRGVSMPYANAVFMLEGKLSFDAPQKQFVVEATRMIEMPSDVQPFAPRVTGTGTFQSKAGDDVLRFRAHCFASGCSTDRLVLSCKYQVAQYLNVVSKMSSGKEMSVTGVLESIGVEGEEMALTYADFSFLARSVASAEGTASAPKSWPIQLKSTPKPTTPKKPKKPAATVKAQPTPPNEAPTTDTTANADVTTIFEDDDDAAADLPSKPEPEWPPTYPESFEAESNLILTEAAEGEEDEQEDEEEVEVIRPRSKRARRDA